MRIEFTRFGKFMIYLMMAGTALLVVGIILSLVAKADGCSVKDCGDPSPSYRKSSIREYLSPEELRTLRRIKDRAEARKASRYSNIDKFDIAPRLGRKPYSPRGEYGPIRYSTSSRHDGMTSSRCQPIIKVTGVERTLQWRAEESARKAWRREAIDRHGYMYASGFRDTRVTCDNIRGYVFICRASGRPCREN